MASAVSAPGTGSTRRAVQLVLDREPVEAVEAGPHHRVIERETFEVECKERVDPRGLDPAP